MHRDDLLIAEGIGDPLIEQVLNSQSGMASLATKRSGKSASIDLRAGLNLDSVVEAIP